MKSLCIIPVYNEDSKLINLVNQIKKNDFKEYNLNYIFINNGSDDNSLKIIKSSKIKYLNLKKNKGVGYALILGFLYAKKYNYHYIVHIAGNGKMKPSEIKNFMDPIIKKNYDYVNGSRFLDGASRKNNPIYRIVLIKIFGLIINFFLKKKISDATCGFRAFKINIFKNFKKNFLDKKLYTYGYEYYSYAKILKNKNIKTTEVACSMDYPSKKNYTKIKPIIDWYIIAKFWIKGIFDNKEL